MKKFILAALLVFLIALTSCSSAKVDLAQCITDSGAKMYGAFWCGSCAQQKSLFGSSAFKAINYIECSLPDRSQTAFCVTQGIDSYPTWEFFDGSRLEGVQTLDTLAEKSGCIVE